MLEDIRKYGCHVIQARPTAPRRPRFQMVQMVYPSREGIWPWDPMADGFLRQLQPLREYPADG